MGSSQSPSCGTVPLRLYQVFWNLNTRKKC
jgi:hypothetical protein